MSKIDFHHNDRPTVGIELELGLVDAETMALASSYGLVNARLTAEGHQDADATRYKPELMQCVLEINTDVCETIGDAERDLTEKLHDRANRRPTRSACGCGGARRIRSRNGATSGSRPTNATCSS